MAEAMIEAEARTEKGTKACRRLRRRGLIPGVLYGHGEECVDIVMNEHDLLLALHTGAHMFDLKVKGRDDESVLIKEIQYDCLGDTIVHLDLQRVSLSDTVEVTVPIVLTGTAIGAASRGIVDQPLRELSISCTPDVIPDEIRATITHLEIGMMLTVTDLEVPAGITVRSAADQVVVTVHPPVTEEEIEAEDEAIEGGTAEPEVIGGAPPSDEAEEGEDATQR